MSNTNSRITRSYPAPTANLSVDTSPRTSGQRTSIEWIPRATDTARKDIADHRRAQALAESFENPNNLFLQNIYTNICNDGMLTSQIENRQTKLFGVDFELQNADGTLNEIQTKAVMDFVPWRDITKEILNTMYYEYSLIQLDWKKNVDGIDRLVCKTLPRTNILPQQGKFFRDTADLSKYIEYRDQKEYGIWWLEFGDASKRGLLNKAVPHVLMKSFAQSCWAELCEIYGIPPRYMKTNTQDPAMKARAEKMMRDMGAAAWFIIDETEEFAFADSVSGGGDVYNGLITMCNNENSMMISGAIIGQDTKNGNRSKDESSQNVLWELVMQDMLMVEDNWNNIVIPALKKIGVIKGDLTFRFDIPEDLAVLWTRVKDSMDNYEFDTDWLNEKFGLKITAVKKAEPTPPSNLNIGESLFI